MQKYPGITITDETLQLKTCHERWCNLENFSFNFKLVRRGKGQILAESVTAEVHGIRSKIKFS